MADIDLMVGNTNPPATAVVAVASDSNPDGEPVDLTGSTIKFRMREESSSDFAVDASATIDGDPTGGRVKYQWTAGDVDTSGKYLGWFQVTYPDTTIQDTPEFSIRIKAHGPVDGYATVESVRSYLSKEANDQAQDDLIADLIVIYSRAVDDYCQRSFALEGNATKSFRVVGNIVSFGGFSLSSIDSVSIDGSELDASQYQLQPVSSRTNTYTSLRLSNYFYTRTDIFGYATAEVTGDWGSSTVPSVVQHAVCKAVAAAIRRDVAFYTQGFAPEADTGAPAIFLPADVRAALQVYKVYGY